MTELERLAVALVGALDHDAEERYWQVRCRDAYRRGRADGWRAGYEEAQRDMARCWREITRPVVSGPARAELERRRWGPGGRAHFGDPRPGDYAPGPAAGAAA